MYTYVDANKLRLAIAYESPRMPTHNEYPHPGSLPNAPKTLHGNARRPYRNKRMFFPQVMSHRTSGAAAAAISLLIGAAPVSAGGLSNKFLQNCGGSKGRWPPCKDG